MEVVDGFKRLAAARLLLPRWTTLSVRVLAVDERGAKAAIYGLNRVSRSTHELEEAWIVHALVREDGLSQVEAAALLARHKSWVCRRLALLERLSPEAKEGLRLGLLSHTISSRHTEKARNLRVSQVWPRLPRWNPIAISRSMPASSARARRTV